MFDGRAELGDALRLLREGLGPFVEQQVARHAPPEARFADFVQSNSWLEGKRVDQWDVAPLLKFVQYMWNDVFQHVLDRDARAFATELQGWRNKWAHQDRLPAEDVDRALDTAARLLRAVDAESQAAEVARLRARLAEPGRTPEPKPHHVPFSPHQANSPHDAHGGQADAIRRYALDNYVKPWRESGGDVLAIRAGDVERGMGLRNATPNVCNALGGRKFLALANVTLVRRDGPQRSTTTTYHYSKADGIPVLRDPV